MKFVKEDDEVVAGIRVFETHGHTQGHISVELKQGSESLVVLGDAMTNPVLSFEYPEWQAGTDHLPDVGAATRKRLLDQLFASKARIIGYHLPPATPTRRWPDHYVRVRPVHLGRRWRGARCACPSVAHLTFCTRLRLDSKPNVRCKSYTRIIVLLVFLMVLNLLRT